MGFFDHNADKINIDDWKQGLNVWNSWNEKERTDFLSERKFNTSYALHPWDIDLPMNIQKAVMAHIAIVLHQEITKN